MVFFLTESLGHMYYLEGVRLGMSGYNQIMYTNLYFPRIIKPPMVGERLRIFNYYCMCFHAQNIWGPPRYIRGPNHPVSNIWVIQKVAHSFATLWSPQMRGKEHRCHHPGDPEDFTPVAQPFGYLRCYSGLSMVQIIRPLPMAMYDVSRRFSPISFGVHSSLDYLDPIPQVPGLSNRTP